jgi:excisionase family DNA binding protein
MRKPKKEITYNRAAAILRCSPRTVRRILKRNGIEPVRRGHRTVRILLEQIIPLVPTN